jgi:BMFP domain-containing protein YqiC
MLIRVTGKPKNKQQGAQRVAELEAENTALRERVAELEAAAQKKQPKPKQGK